MWNRANRHDIFMVYVNAFFNLIISCHFLISCAQVQVFINQIYKVPVEKRLDKNPDLLAIRFASTNPILDPWIYILLRKAVLIKLTKNINYLFCKIIARGQQKQASFQWLERQRVSSIISKDSLSLVSQNMREIRSTSQTFLYLSAITESYKDTCSVNCNGSSLYSPNHLGSEGEAEICPINHTSYPLCLKETDPQMKITLWICKREKYLVLKTWCSGIS